MNPRQKNDSHRLGHFTGFFANQIISGLEDQNDDIQGVASQILAYSLPHINSDQAKHSGFLPRIIPPLWKSVENVRVFSSSINALVKLLSKLIRGNSTGVLEVVSNRKSSLYGLIEIFSRASEILDCELISVKISVLDVIRSLSNELVQLLNSTIMSESDKEKARRCFSSVVKDVYGLCCATSVAIGESRDDKDDDDSDDSDDDWDWVEDDAYNGDLPCMTACGNGVDVCPGISQTR